MGMTDPADGSDGLEKDQSRKPGAFEMICRDGLARICRFSTKHGDVTTPALLPVINPNLMIISPQEMQETFGTQMVITNSYVISKHRELREEALEKGVHELIDFKGPIMTDSGTFQSYVYGKEGTDPVGIVEFQRDIGCDVGTILDIFSTPDDTYEDAKKGMSTTLERAKEAAQIQGEMILATTVQGGIFKDLREEHASAYARFHSERSDGLMAFYPIGGVVPLMESYRFSELAEVIIAAKRGLPPGRPVHLFGAGHPMIFPIVALLGCDLFDSSAYAKFAKDGRMMTSEGTLHLERMEENPCPCPACLKYSVKELKQLEPDLRTRQLSIHNLHVSFAEMRRVREAIRQGTLWDLVEQRCSATPALLGFLKAISAESSFFEKFEPLSRGGFTYVSSNSLNRPVIKRFVKRISQRYKPCESSVQVTFLEGIPPYHGPHRKVDELLRKGNVRFQIETLFGLVPMELDELYPVGPAHLPHWEKELPDRRALESMWKDLGHSSRYGYISEDTYPVEVSIEWMGKETLSELDEHLSGPIYPNLDLLRVRAVCDFQFGPGAAMALFGENEKYSTITTDMGHGLFSPEKRGNDLPESTEDVAEGIVIIKSKRTGRIRNVLVDGKHILSMRANDGYFTLKIPGAKRLCSLIKPPTMRVVVTEDSIPYNRKGYNVFPRFVESCDPGLRPGDEVLVTGEGDELVAIGQLQMNPSEIDSFEYGVAVKIREGLEGASKVNLRSL